jgi:PAS domain S-box-containing protein
MALRILAVEDSPTQAAVLHAALEAGGYAVTEARSGEEALEAVAAGTFDVVVSDIVMPGSVDGYELCRRVKSEHPALPVILLTSLSDPLDIIRGLEAGADNFLTKPYTPEHLLERLGVLLATRRTRKRARVQAGVSVQLMDRHFVITSKREQILDLLVTTFEDAVHQNREVRLREEDIARSRERLSRMYDGVVALNHCTTEQEVVDSALDGATRLPRVRAAWIVLRDGEAGFRLAGTRDMPPVLSAPGALDGDCRCRRMLLAGELDSVTNILECERITRTAASGEGVRYHASVPLHCGGQVIGVMNLLSEDETLFDEDDRTILYGIGSQIGFAIERARMLRRLETSVEERTRESKESEERFRTLVTEVSDGFFVTDADGVLTFANPALARIHGVDDPSQLEGRRFADFLPERVKAGQLESFSNLVAGSVAAPLVTTTIRRPDGSEAVAELRPTPILRDGKVVGTRGVMRDVTERVRTEEALRLSDSILQHIGDLVLVADGEGLITYASPSVEAILGYRPEELLGAGWWNLAWDDPEGARRERASVAARVGGAAPPDAAPQERSVRASDGSTRWILWKETKGPEDLFIRVGHDVTEHRRLQEQFLQAQKMEAVGRLAGGIAHDFNNVLTSILITTELLLPGLTEDDATRADVQAIRSAAERAAALTQQLLAFSRKQVLKPKVVSLNDLVEGMEGMLRSLLGEDIAIEVLLAPDLGNVEMDPGKMEQVIMNLAVNARDALPRGGRLLLETRNVDLNGDYVRGHPDALPGPHVVLNVTDDGLGMDPAVMEHIFEPFFTTKGVGQGTGLGLATVHGIVNQSGGHIWVYSEPGGGTTFKIYLPRVSAEVSAPAPAAARRSEVAATETILLVEDDDAVRRAADRVLRRAGYTVVAVDGGAGALAAMEAHRGAVDLLITDVVMPGMTGPDLAQRLLRDAPGLRVLFVSGYTDEVIARQGLIGPGHHFLEKPFVVDSFLDRVREVLGHPGPPARDRAETEAE